MPYPGKESPTRGTSGVCPRVAAGTPDLSVRGRTHRTIRRQDDATHRDDQRLRGRRAADPASVGRGDRRRHARRGAAAPAVLALDGARVRIRVLVHRGQLGMVHRWERDLLPVRRRMGRGPDVRRPRCRCRHGARSDAVGDRAARHACRGHPGDPEHPQPGSRGHRDRPADRRDRSGRRRLAVGDLPVVGRRPRRRHDRRRDRRHDRPGSGRDDAQPKLSDRSGVAQRSADEGRRGR